MSQRGWLKGRRGERSWRVLAEAVHARLPPEDADAAGQLGSLSNRLRTTDSGKTPSGWWGERRAVAVALAEEIGAELAEVEAWIGATPPSGSSHWRPLGLRSLERSERKDPPKRLWPDLLDEWVREIERGEVEPRTAWAALEPGLPTSWFLETLEQSGWDVHRDARPHQVARKLRRGQRVVVLPAPVASTHAQPAPDLPDQAALLVLSAWPLMAPGDPRHPGEPSYRDPLPIWEGWALLGRTERERCSAHDIFIWFDARVSAERRVDRTTLEGTIAQLEDKPLPGELLLLLDTLGDGDLDDAVVTLLERHPSIVLEDLQPIEREAQRRGVGGARTQDTWRSLAGAPGDPATALARVTRALADKRYGTARKLAEKATRAVVDQLLEGGLLQPSPLQDGTWALWPRWLGESLCRQATEIHLKQAEGIGALLLAGEHRETEALTHLETLAHGLDEDALLAILDATPGSPEATAAIEGVALAVGHALLDGVDLSPDLATRIIVRLDTVRSDLEGRWTRLLPHGEGRTSLAAMQMAEWALGWRADTPNLRLGPWSPETPVEALVPALEELHRGLDRWTAAAWPSPRRWQPTSRPTIDADEAGALARRLARLGTLVHRSRGLLPKSPEATGELWAFQVPVALIAACDDPSNVPGRSPEEIFEERIDSEYREALQRGIELERSGAAWEAGQDWLARVGASLAFSAAVEEPEAQTRIRFLRTVSQVAHAHFALLEAEVRATGGSLSDVLRWLWALWNHPGESAHESPPARLVQEGRLDEARLVWRGAPGDIRREIWERAAEGEGLWEILEPRTWRAWARHRFERSDGWQRMPPEILVSLLLEDLPDAAYEAAWMLAPEETCALLVGRIGDELDGSVSKTLAATPSAWAPVILERAKEGALPGWWLQVVVTRRAEGWREAWGRLM